MALKRLPVIGQDQGTWGQLLNDNLKQFTDPNKGGINIWTTSTRPAPLTADDEGRSGVNKDTGKIERWNGIAWEILGQQIVTPYVDSTGTFSASYGTDFVLNIVGVGTKFTDFKKGDIIVAFDGTNLGTKIEFDKIIDDTHAIGSIDRIQDRVKDIQELGPLVVSGDTYTVGSTAGLAVGDTIDYLGLIYGDIVTQIVDATHFKGKTPIGFGSSYNIVAYKYPRPGSNYKIGRASFSINDTLDGTTKMTVSNFRSKFEAITTEKFIIDNEVLINTGSYTPINLNSQTKIKNRYPSIVQNWTIGNYAQTARTSTLIRSGENTKDIGAMSRITHSLMRSVSENNSDGDTNTLTDTFEVLALEHYLSGSKRSGITNNTIGLRITNNIDYSKGAVYRTYGIVSYPEENFFAGKIGINNSAPAERLQLNGTALFCGDPFGNLVNNGFFNNSGTDWTFNTGWAFQDYNDALGQWNQKWARHTPGSTATLTCALTQAVDVTKLYTVSFTVKNQTAGSVTASLGGVVITGVNNKYNVFSAQPINTTTLTFTPTSDFDGAIDDVYVYGYNPDAGRNINFGRIGVNTLNPTESVDVVGNIKVSGKIKAPGLQDYATNAAALAAGLAIGDMYHTAGTVKVVI